MPTKKINELPITTLDILKKSAEGDIVQLPGFTESVPFIAMLKRPSMMALAKSGKIPNELLASANKLFYQNGAKQASCKSDELAQMFRLMDVICEACFVNPTFEELKEAGISLTDEQYIAVFNYSQQGIKALAPFRSI